MLFFCSWLSKKRKLESFSNSTGPKTANFTLNFIQVEICISKHCQLSDTDLRELTARLDENQCLKEKNWCQMSVRQFWADQPTCRKVIPVHEPANDLLQKICYYIMRCFNTSFKCNSTDPINFQSRPTTCYGIIINTILIFCIPS